jgi:hypothetical protein
MMAITKQNIAAIVTIIVLNTLLYGNFVTTKAYALGAQEWEEIMRLPPEQQLEAIEKYQQESQEAFRNATIAGAQERQAEREQDRLAWPQQHQQAIQEMETALQQAEIDFNTIRQAGNETIAKELSNAQVQAAQAQDPQFKTFVDIWQSCMNSLLSLSNTTILPGQCTTPFIDANIRSCGIDQYDSNKCRLSSQMSVDFSQLSAGLVYSLERVTNLQEQLTELRSLTFFDVNGCLWYERDAGLCE